MWLYDSLWFVVFFFKQKTAYEMRISDWSSDVCSSDLPASPARPPPVGPTRIRAAGGFPAPDRSGNLGLRCTNQGSQIAPEYRRVRGYPIVCCDRFRRHPARHSRLKGIDLEWPRPRETIAAN